MIRELLVEEDKIIYDQIEKHILLGANNHIIAIGNMIENIMLKKNIDNFEKKEQVKKVCQYYISTRGQASQAITNAIYKMINNIDTVDITSEVFTTEIIKNKNMYFNENKKNLDKILEYAVNISKKFDSILVYDYSSTVEKFLIKLSEDRKERILYIPESRVINGGKPFLSSAVNTKKYNIHFIPDCAIAYYMKNIDACYMGAETMYTDGSCFNTLGSDIVGILCDYYKVPLYFLTPMIKLDSRAVYGIEKKLVMDDLKDKFSEILEKKYMEKGINFIVPELVKVESKYIAAIITEKGVIPANQMFHIANEYYNELREGVNFNG